ncbi:Faa1/Faa4 [Kluyveromyces lactis]|nr:Faa1/Faa4 [Kluyveromyces lactis]
MVVQYSVPVGPAANEHETAPRRNALAKKAPITRPAGMKCSTVYEFAVECFEKNADRKSVGWRDIIDIHREKKMVTKKIDGKDKEVEKEWFFYELSAYKYTTYKELNELVHDYGRGLVKLGLEPASEDKLHIFASTSHRWMKTFLATQSQAIPVVTAYDTLGEKGLIHSMVQTASKGMFVDNALLCRLHNAVQEATNLKYLIISEELNPEDKRDEGKLYKDAADALAKIKEVRPDIKILSMDEVIELGKKARDEIEPHPPAPEDLSAIMYTSGSTGDPKGVILKHSNIVAGLGGISSIISNRPEHVSHTDRVIAFLPLAHIFELAFELITFYWGATLGYANVKTLTDASVRNCQGDIKEFQPTIMVGVAAVWESVRKGILAQINKLPALTQKVFWTGYYAKLKMKKFHIPGGDTLGNILFKKVREATGGHLRFVLNGGSPLSREAQEFITNLICPMLIGYGLTETMANTTILQPEHFEYGVAGDIVGSITVKLVDVEELGYFAKNSQGEVWIKGGPVTPEYYKNEEETKGSITDDGWFKTGDIAEWTPKGQLKIIDRKKNLVKTQNGEYIALEKLESVYRSCPYVQNICVYADQTKVKPVGIIVPNEAAITEKAIKMDLLKKGEDVTHLYHNDTLKHEILQEMLKVGRSQGLSGIELLQGIVVFEEEWTPQNGFVTSAQKLQRKKILAAVQDEVDEVYSKSN